MRSRLALLRWIVRVVRAERRQHALVVLLVALGITLAVMLVTTAVQLNQPQQSFDGFDNELYVRTSSEDPATVQEFNAEASRLIDENRDLAFVVTSRTNSRLVQVVGADPQGTPFEQQYELLKGTWPTAGEVAITERAGERLTASAGLTTVGASVGTIVTLNGNQLMVSGLFEDRWALNDAVAIAPPSELQPWSTVRFLVPNQGHPIVSESLEKWGIDDGATPVVDGAIQAFVFDKTRTGDSDASAVGGAYLIGTVLALQIAILASAGFTVLAQRRTRQLGMLSALGASPRRLAGVLRTTGLVVGVAGGLFGLVLGVSLSIAATPLLQLVVPYRLNRFNLPWLALLPMVPLAVATSLVAAWWPARRIRRMSTMDAIGSRRPTNGRTVPAAIIGLVLAAGGTWALIIGAPKNSPTLVAGGVIATTVGALLCVPIVVSLLGRVASAASLPVRIGWRDLDRNRSRTSAAAAAAAIAIAVPFAIATFTYSLSNTWRPQLPDDTVSFSGQFMFNEEDDVTRAEVEAAIAPLREVVSDLEVLVIEMPIDVEATARNQQRDSEHQERYWVRANRQSGTVGLFTAIASDDLLDAMGLEPPGEGVDVLTTSPASLDLPEGVVIERRTARYDGFPDVILMNEIEGTSFEDPVPGGWYLQKATPFTRSEMDRMEAIAESSPNWLFVSGAETRPPFLAIRLAALGTAGLLGLSVVAVAVALIRTESQADTRSLNAIGAPPRTSRFIGSATAAGLATIAIVIAVPAAFAVLSGVYLNPDEEFDFAIPWIELMATGLVLPAIAAVGGWLMTTTQVRSVSS